MYCCYVFETQTAWCHLFDVADIPLFACVISILYARQFTSKHDKRTGHTVQYCAQWLNCTVYPPRNNCTKCGRNRRDFNFCKISRQNCTVFLPPATVLVMAWRSCFPATFPIQILLIFLRLKLRENVVFQCYKSQTWQLYLFFPALFISGIYSQRTRY